MKSIASAPRAKPFDKRRLVWLAGPEVAAFVAVVVAIPYVISRLIVLHRERVARGKNNS